MQVSAAAKKAAKCKRCVGVPGRTCDVEPHPGEGVCGREVCPHLSKREMRNGVPFDICGPCNMRMARARKAAGK
jgi:hypothetical protein